MRTDKKKKKMIFKKSIPPEFSFGYEWELGMFLDLWHKEYYKNKKVVCPYTGEDVTHLRSKDSFYSCFSHILPKGRYPYFKFNPANIRIVYPLFHRIVDQGTMKDRTNHPDWKFDQWDADVLLMKEEYRKFKEKNLLP